MPSSGYTAISFTAGEQPTTAKWNLIGSNDSSFNTGNGFNDSIIGARHIGSNVINQSHVDWTTSTPGGIWWQELGRTTLGAAGDTLSVSFTAKKYLKFHLYVIPSGSIGVVLRMNGDTAANYAYRYAVNGGADAAAAATNSIILDGGTPGAFNFFVEGLILNTNGSDKPVVGQSVNIGGSGASTGVTKMEYEGKWANSSTQITSLAATNLSTGDYAVGSEIVVLGHD